MRGNIIQQMMPTALARPLPRKHPAKWREAFDLEDLTISSERIMCQPLLDAFRPKPNPGLEFSPLVCLKADARARLCDIDEVMKFASLPLVLIVTTAKHEALFHTRTNSTSRTPSLGSHPQFETHYITTSRKQSPFAFPVASFFGSWKSRLHQRDIRPELRIQRQKKVQTLAPETILQTRTFS